MTDTQRPEAEIATDLEPGEIDWSDAATVGREAVKLGLLVSAVRCVLLYLVLPAAGIAGSASGIGGVLSIALHLVAVAAAYVGVRKAWGVPGRRRTFTLALAAIVVLNTVVSIASAFL